MPEEDFCRDNLAERAATPQASMQHTTAELIDLLKRAQRLGLSFDIGTAYIRRSYIDEQTELNQLINEAVGRAAIAKATGSAS